ncbi:hypothetical protein CIPAW_01G189200 [Carya illinoinensis]|uniref:Uncharacterized protein n=2 Tax=Carya illinoinensis TaxID=32201 RepID=A0A8T1RNF0_CARIL|nr:hypothetical protein CIPAW_01G189200 [Carya illinoinensis]KAG6668697.1 hypothetical protein CIPAW_01G189200 [Carya illinoinensis]
MTRAGARRRKNLCQESSDCARVDAAENNENVEEPAHSAENIRTDVDIGATTEVDALENVEETNLEENDIINAGKGTATGFDDEVERGSGSGVEGEGLDLERMTLEDWFNYMEVHLPKQIIRKSEEMIEGMGQKAERVREYILEKRNERGKVPMG